MKKRPLGKTGLTISELSLGGFFISSFGGDYDQSKKAVQKALQCGVNYIDTAPDYANSEDVLGRCLTDISPEQEIIISTKIGGNPKPFFPKDKDCIMKSIEGSLKLLHRESIDIMMIHEPDRPGQYDWWTDYNEYSGPAMELLTDLKRQGIVHYIGLAGTTAYELAGIVKSKKFDVVLTAFNYSLLWREAEIAVLPEAKKLGMGIIIGSPLQMGALAKRYDEEVKSGAKWLSPPRRAQFLKLYQLADEVQMSLPELGLRFILSNGGVSSILTGACTEAEVEKNVEYIEKGPLPAEILKRIDEISAMVPFRPFEEPFALPFGQQYKGPGVVNSSWL
jgi:D-threo-aldose 1-dehydrogenase